MLRKGLKTVLTNRSTSGVVPKGHGILPEEREKIVAFKRQHPTVGGVRLAYRMLDQGVVAVSPSTVSESSERPACQADGLFRTDGKPPDKVSINPRVLTNRGTPTFLISTSGARIISSSVSSTAIPGPSSSGIFACR